ncbi:MAG: TolC family protein [Bacteroidales bacterium]
MQSYLNLLRLFGILFFLLASTPAVRGAEREERDTLYLSLEEARQYAVEHSYDMRRARKDLDIAEKQVWETTAEGLPQINASVGYNYYLDIPTSLVPAEFFGGQPGEFREIQFGTEQNITATASVEQLIFDGQYIVGLRASRIFRDLADQTLERSGLEVKNTVTETYFLVLLARQNLDIVRQNLRNMEMQLEETRELLKEGFTDPINVDQLQLTVSNLENRISSLKRQEEVTTRLLKLQLGLDMEEQIRLTGVLEDLHQDLMNDLSFLTDFAPEHHIAYRMAQSQEEMSLMVMRREQSAYLPSLSASFIRQEMAMRDEFNFFDSEQSWFPSTYFAVNLNIPIFSSGLRSARVAQARIELDKARIDREETFQSLTLQMQEAMANFDTAREQYKTAQDNLGLAQRIFDRTSIMFREGMASSLELTQANDQLMSTQANYYHALFEVLNARNNIQKALGTGS